MAAKQQPYTTLPEQQHLHNFALQPSKNQGEQSGYKLSQVSYPPQQGGFQPSQASYPPQQGGFQPSQASYPPQQGGFQPSQATFPPQQGSDATQQASYPLQQGPQQGGYSPQQAGLPPQQAGYLSAQPSYQPPEAGYLPQQGYSQPPPQQTQVINQQPGVIQNTDDASFGVSPVRTVCPHCRVTVLTTTQYVPGLTACLCCLLCGIFACCYYEEIMDVQHDCPLCKNKIAVYERSC